MFNITRAILVIFGIGCFIIGKFEKDQEYYPMGIACIIGALLAPFVINFAATQVTLINF